MDFLAGSSPDLTNGLALAASMVECCEFVVAASVTGGCCPCGVVAFVVNKIETSEHVTDVHAVRFTFPYFVNDG